MLDTGIASSLCNIKSVATFGNPSTSLNFKDQGNSPLSATIRMPAPGMTIGATATIYVSEDN